jgi:hypothetical protein
MIFSIPQQDMRDIISAMKACAMIEEHRKEKILRPLRKQLERTYWLHKSFVLDDQDKPD